MKTLMFRLVLVGAMMAAAISARAQLTADWVFDGTNTTMTYTLAANTSLGTSSGTQSFGISGKDLNLGNIRSAPNPTPSLDLYSLGSTYTNTIWGTISSYDATSRSGDALWTAFPNGQVYVPVGYNSALGLSGQMTWESRSLTDLGFASNSAASGTFNVGVLTVDWSTINTTAVPEPSTYAILAGLGALGLAIGRRRATKA